MFPSFNLYFKKPTKSFAVHYSSCLLGPKLQHSSQLFPFTCHQSQVPPYRCREAELESERAGQQLPLSAQNQYNFPEALWWGEQGGEVYSKFSILKSQYFKMQLHSPTKDTCPLQTNFLPLKVPAYEPGRHFIFQCLNSGRHLLSSSIKHSLLSNWTIHNTDELKCMSSL